MSPIRASERPRYPADWPAKDHHAETRAATRRAELADQMNPLFEVTG